MRLLEVGQSHHSLVTPIDWKLRWDKYNAAAVRTSHHSLVTPIDWKQGSIFLVTIALYSSSHHSLVTPIDWKLSPKLMLLPVMVMRSPLAGDTY